MNRILILIISVCFFFGCVSLQRATEPEKIIPEQQEKEFEDSDAPPELQNIKGEELEEYVQKNGVIFAKTDFQGVLKTNYVIPFIKQIDASIKNGRSSYREKFHNIDEYTILNHKFQRKGGSGKEYPLLATPGGEFVLIGDIRHDGMQVDRAKNHKRRVDHGLQVNQGKQKTGAIFG